MFKLVDVQNPKVKIHYPVHSNTNAELCKWLRKCDASAMQITASSLYNKRNGYHTKIKDEYRYGTLDEVEHYTYLEHFDELSVKFGKFDRSDYLEITYKREYDIDNWYLGSVFTVTTRDPDFDLGTFFEKQTGEKYIPEPIPESAIAPTTENPVKFKFDSKFDDSFAAPYVSHAQLDNHAYIKRTYLESGQTSSLKYAFHADHIEYEKLANIFNDFCPLYLRYHDLSYNSYYFGNYRSFGDIIVEKKHHPCKQLEPNEYYFDFTWSFSRHLSKDEVQKFDEWLCEYFEYAYEFAFPMTEIGAHVHHR